MKMNAEQNRNFIGLFIMIILFIFLAWLHEAKYGASLLDVLKILWGDVSSMLEIIKT